MATNNPWSEEEVNEAEEIDTTKQPNLHDIQQCVVTDAAL